MSYQYIIMKDFPFFVFENNEKKQISPEIIINININTFSKNNKINYKF